MPAKKAPAAQVTFDVCAVPVSLALLAQRTGVRLNYTASDCVPEPVLRLPDGAELRGYPSIIGHIDPSLAAHDVVQAAVIPALYGAEPPRSDNPALAAVYGLITDDTTGDEGLDALIVGAPHAEATLSGSPVGQALWARYDGSKEMKIARGQIGVALKNYEKALLPSGGPTLEGAVIGKVCTRFPPEPSGYLHIGHAKAAMLNHYFAREYRGRLHFRMDDTNPSKERPEFVENLKRDLRTLGIDYDSFSYTSDHFELMEKKAEELIHAGLAYCDQTTSEEMQHQRFNGLPSAFRDSPIQDTLRLWGEMLQGTPEGQKTCLRAKISIDDPNKCMRDPVIYRVNVTDPHPRTGTRYKAYPTYDFACPIVDSIEGITHALRTTEFLDRNPQYWWFCDALGLRKPAIQDFSRLRLQYSIMSKRHLQWFVDEGLVEGWFDPRFPTVQGLMRRGLRPDALRAFILEQGATRRVNYQEWSKIWAVNKQYIEPTAKRFHAVHAEGCVTARILNMLFCELRDVSVHPKDASLGTKKVLYRNRILLDGSDLDQMQSRNLGPGDKVTLMGWGNMRIDKVDYETRDLALSPCLEDTSYTGTLKLTWIADSCTVKRARACYFGHLVTKAVLGPGEDFRDYVNQSSLQSFDILVQGNLLSYVRPGDTIQLERWGFYYLDRIEDGVPILHYVPEGKGSCQVGAFSFEIE
ncbi:Glutamate-tRNA ligase [Giardia muris]|uniref:glutamate--tRNA ligase n=1 Tax=Giardia muris TaxID=5742 RepID=A0A4Z1SPN3_GIAMU|nr:Glutamate-tRNA ligase [Giardia muris]|eukprot:TNJ27782.1 Glutamate-tRNA ligase [Giardia muris]